MELLRLNKLLEAAKSAHNVKRLGIRGKYYWLVVAQEFARIWGTRHCGEALALVPPDLADLIDASLQVLGQRKAGPTDVDRLRKALANFRKNPKNQTLMSVLSKKTLADLLVEGGAASGNKI